MCTVVDLLVKLDKVAIAVTVPHLVQAAQLEALAKLSPPRDPIDAQVAGQESASVPDLLTLSKRMAFRVGSAPLQSFASDDADWNTELETEMRKLDHDS
eukprot:SAG31_NODE_13_length_37961_cov_21.751307_22_plen_99_part_00